MSKRISLALMRGDSVFGSILEAEFDYRGGLSKAIKQAKMLVKSEYFTTNTYHEVTHIAVIVFPIDIYKPNRIIAKFPIEENIRLANQRKLELVTHYVIQAAKAFILRDNFDYMVDEAKSKLKDAVEEYEKVSRAVLDDQGNLI
jgi:hypothetical protein